MPYTAYLVAVTVVKKIASPMETKWAAEGWPKKWASLAQSKNACNGMLKVKK